jgi:protein phosphatase-4 regulatory subunit 3
MAAAPQFSSRRRVKVYHLVEDGQWEDKGTGYVQCVYSEKFDGAAIVVTAEDEPRRVILEAKIYVEDIYQCQQDTLIVWSDPMSGKDFALSFQEHAGCSDIGYASASLHCCSLLCAQAADSWDSAAVE